ncbi:hypothetical protein [Serratia fonticola]|uniref:hypothetical protein n=1 Tax=Serratia fonticola TaxID=47917 RepID=UPI00192B14E7|nr:hypothetical protein [Serratia fonticola]MBL5906111.1 hypothetical protein [Serratia fonticola]
MAKYHEIEVLRAGTLGSYITNAMITRINSEGDLFPDCGEPFPGAVSLHAHEFTHYLHNFSTQVGFNMLASCIWLLNNFSRGANNVGGYENKHDVSSSDSAKLSFLLLKSMRGSVSGILPTYSAKKIKQWCFSQVREEKRNLIHSTEGHLGDICVHNVNIDIINSSGDTVSFSVQFGLNFISEGVAYEIEREIRKGAGIPESMLDDQTPIFPYLAYKPFIDHLVGRETSSEERISIGNYALLTSSASKGLLDGCYSLKLDSELNTSENFDSYKKTTLSKFKSRVNNINEMEMKNLLETLKGSEILSKGFEFYSQLILTALNMRLSDPNVEMKLIEKQMTGDDFNKLTSNILERWVCQEKADRLDEINWIGCPGGLIESEEETLSAVSILQSCIHYVQCHFSLEGNIIETLKLPNIKCPFSGACQVEEDEGNPDVCKTKPWNFKRNNQEQEYDNKVCWYIAGVKAITPI